ncbi:MAG: S-methyl-5'-thioadenosine phosphorylase [Candidatus Bathyarchaeia archaeon]
MAEAEIGVFGGSGLYDLLSAVEEVKVDTPYGPPSDIISVGEIEGRRVAFLPRHGRRHQHPPHTIPYRANLWAMKSLGVRRIIAPCSTGSLQPHIKPGDIVVCDQFVDRTRGRKDTFYDGPVATHISTSEPYCPELRSIVINCAEALALKVHPRGVVVVIQGPRFSTKAESLWFKSQGWDVINMTQYPEVVLARELEMCYVNISLVTDYDVWREEPVSAEVVSKVFSENIEKVRKLIYKIIPEIPTVRRCPCSTALKSSRL